MSNTNIKLLAGVARINQGDFNIQSINMDTKTVTIYSRLGTQTIMFDSLDGLKLFVQGIPTVLNPN